jgi:rhodanese-related sulfurtransferase
MEHFPEFVANHLFLFSLLVAILALLIWNLYGDTVSGIKQIIPMEATRLINHENAMLVDLRNQADYASGHILNARNIPATELAERLKELHKYKQQPVILCCNNGSESGRAARLMMQGGFEKIFCLKGGLHAWRSANLPLTRDSASE